MMTLKPDLFDFAFVPDWYGQLDELAQIALPEPWRFKKPTNVTKNQDTPILERYIHMIFRKQCIEFNSAEDDRKAAQFFHVENERACFHTGLYNSRYKGIYAFFDRNHKKDSMLEWYFRGFCDELSPWLRYIQPLPQKPSYYTAKRGAGFNPDWPIRVRRIHDRKLEKLEDLIEAANGQSVLIAYWYKHDRERIVSHLDKMGIRARDIKTSEDITDWNAGTIPVALIHPASAGHGLNIQQGGHILVWFGLTWSLELYQQTNARLWRQGQTEVVSIHHIVTKGTVDEDVMAALEAKDVTQEKLIAAVRARLYAE